MTPIVWSGWLAQAPCPPNRTDHDVRECAHLRPTLGHSPSWVAASAASWPSANPDGDCLDLRDLFDPKDNGWMSTTVEDMPCNQSVFCPWTTSSTPSVLRSTTGTTTGLDQTRSASDGEKAPAKKVTAVKRTRKKLSELQADSSRLNPWCRRVALPRPPGPSRSSPGVAGT
jgi:hypothetical protein